MQRSTADAVLAAEVYRVDDLVVDTARVIVTRDGVELPLPKLSFDLLIALVAAAPRVVSLDELLDTVWAGVVVSPETVSQRVKLLRDALGDDPKSPRYVSAVRGRGYRLVAPVMRLPPVSSGETPAEGAVLDTTGAVAVAVGDAATAPAPTTPAINVDVRSSATSSWRWLGAALVVLFVASLAVMLRRGSAPEPPVVAPAAEVSIAVLPFVARGDEPDGPVLAFGIAEAVLHRLANVPGLVVIARTSSFSLDSTAGDARSIGRKLDVHYLLEGSVQQDDGRLRVTAQLIDTASGAHVWSIRFDEQARDIFAVQDTIASEVAKALQVSVQDPRRLTGEGTRVFEAYLAYLQGRARLATRRLADAPAAIAAFEQSVRLDPTFAAAYASLAEAEVFAAEFDVPAERARHFAQARRRALDLVDKAIALDARCAPAYLERGYLQAFDDLKAAESSYREGLRLRPNDARGYAGLAAVLFERPAERGTALQLLDRARRLDPLEPAHDVTKAVFLLYDRGDVDGADALLRNVLQRQPQYLPALVRLGELAWCCEANSPEAIELLERALALDAAAHWPRRMLVRAYLDVDEPGAAAAVAAQSPAAPEVLLLPVLAYQGQWQAAGEYAYTMLEQQRETPVDETVAAVAIQHHARITRDYPRAIDALTRLSGITWARDLPDVPARPGMRAASIALADVLEASGDAVRARALRDVLVRLMGEEMRGGSREPTWYYFGMSATLALDGDRERALDWLQRGFDDKMLAHDATFLHGGNPAFDSLRADSRFRELEQRLAERRTGQQGEVRKLRAEGRVPARPWSADRATRTRQVQGGVALAEQGAAPRAQ